MKLEKKHLFIVGIILIVTFHMTILLPVIPVTESYYETVFDWDANTPVHMPAHMLEGWSYAINLPAEGLSLGDIDIDGELELCVDVRKVNRTVYKSIIELLLGS